MPHSLSPSHDLSDYAAKLDDLLTELRNSIEKRIELRKDIAARIELMDDETEKTILNMRYISGKSFEKIAVDLNYHYQTILRLHRRALIHFPYRQ